MVGTDSSLWIYRAPWRNFFRDFFATFTSDPYTPNDQWKKIPGPSDRPRGETPAGSGTVTPTPEATEPAATATGERDIDPSNPLRSVPKKKANSPFLVHQKWKQEQELRRRKAAAERGSSSGKGEKEEGGYEEPATDLTGPVRVMVKVFRWVVMVTAIVMAAGFFVAGDPLWGYRGKYTKLRTYLPVSLPPSTLTHLFCFERLTLASFPPNSTRRESFRSPN